MWPFVCVAFNSHNKAIVDYTLPALCTSITPFLADAILSKHSSNIMILMVHDIIGDRVIPFAVSAS